MAKITNFGVWEKEVVWFANEVCTEINSIPREKLMDWFYNEGFTAFHDIQRQLYSKYVKESLDADKRYPRITPEYMIGQKFEGFMAMLPEFHKAFPLGHEDRKFIDDKFAIFTNQALANHRHFYALQAVVTNNVHAYLSKNPQDAKSREKMFEFTLQQFEEAKISHPDLINEIDAQILIMKEVHGSVVQENKATNQNNTQQNLKAPGKAGIFGQDPAPALDDEAPIEELTIKPLSEFIPSQRRP